MKRVKTQKWDVNVTNEIFEIKIASTNLRNIITNWDKVVKYVDLYKNGNTDYPSVILEKYKDTEHFEIIDGAHRIKALDFLGLKNVKANLVINHN